MDLRGMIVDLSNFPAFNEAHRRALSAILIEMLERIQSGFAGAERTTQEHETRLRILEEATAPAPRTTIVDRIEDCVAASKTVMARLEDFASADEEHEARLRALEGRQPVAPQPPLVATFEANERSKSIGGALRDTLRLAGLVVTCPCGSRDDYGPGSAPCTGGCGRMIRVNLDNPVAPEVAVVEGTPTLALDPSTPRSWRDVTAGEIADAAPSSGWPKGMVMDMAFGIVARDTEPPR